MPPRSPAADAPVDEARRPARRRSRLVSWGVSAYAVAVFLYAFLNQWGWPWLLLSVVPPVGYLALSALSLGLAALTGQVRRCLAVVLAGALAGLHLLGLNPSAVTGPPAHRADAPALHVTSWNTEYWDQTDDPSAFHAFLRQSFHDVMLLQESLALAPDGTTLRPVDDTRRLAAEFPTAHIVRSGELVVISRLPVRQVTDVGANAVRVDLDGFGATPVSVYDVHLPTQLDLGQGVLSRDFYATMAARYREREDEVRALVLDMQGNPNPTLVAGDFNTSQSMGSITPLQDMSTDAIEGSRSLLPSSWNAHSGVRLFRLDWMLVRNGLVPSTFAFVDPRGMSDHDLQDAVVDRVA